MFTNGTINNHSVKEPGSSETMWNLQTVYNVMNILSGMIQSHLTDSFWSFESRTTSQLRDWMLSGSVRFSPSENPTLPVTNLLFQTVRSFHFNCYNIK